MEIWKEIPDYGNHYEASNLGRVRVKDKIVMKSVRGKLTKQFYKRKILKQSSCPRGYKNVSIGFDNKTFAPRVSRLILMAFDRIPNSNEFACHNNSDPSDNRIENLRWGTQKDNMKDRIARGKYLCGENHFMTKLTNNQVLEIYNSDELGTDLAKIFNVSTNTISRIRNGKLWKNLTGGQDRKISKNYIGKRPQDKFTPNIIREIRNLRNQTGAFYKNIAKQYNTNEVTIWRICTKKSWKHIE